MMLLAAALAQALDISAGQLPAPPPQFPFTSNAGIDLGCLGALEGSRFPAQIYDPVHDERIMYNVSRCTGGYIHATNEVTGKSWRIGIAPGGGVSGSDVRGDKWRYDRQRKVFVNLATHTACATPNYRAMCAAAPNG